MRGIHLEWYVVYGLQTQRQFIKHLPIQRIVALILILKKNEF